MERKVKYVILKIEDIRKYLRAIDIQILLKICRRVDKGRTKDKKDSPQYYVVNCDEPYAEEVFAVIRDGENAKETAKEIEGELNASNSN